MLAAAWVLGAAVLLGVVLAGFYMAERPVRGAGRVASIAHGVLAAGGTALLVTVGGSDRQGFGRLALIMLGLALLGGLLVVLAQVRRRRPSGLVVMLHATMGVAGYVMLVAALSVG